MGCAVRTRPLSLTPRPLARRPRPPARLGAPELFALQCSGPVLLLIPFLPPIDSQSVQMLSCRMVTGLALACAASWERG
jgi:hypothetical protein